MVSEDILNDRKNKFLKIGRGKGFMSKVDDLSSLNSQKNNLLEIIKSKRVLISTIGFAIVLLISLIIYL